MAVPEVSSPLPSSGMNVYICTDFKGIWPVGTAAVIVAENREQARELLDTATPFPNDESVHIEPLNTEEAMAHILRDGDY